MADRPILFSGQMVRALLAGTKTQTRRALRFQPRSPYLENGDWWDETAPGAATPMVLKAYVGDRLYVREHWRTTSGLDWTVEGLGRPLKPREFDPKTTPVEYLADDENELGGKDRRAMHMPRWASRMTLIVTDVRVERLRDISEADAIAEGIEQSEKFPDRYLTPAGDYAVPKVAYQRLWETINGPGSWDANPWVAAYTFRFIKQNIDQIEREAA